MKTSKSREQFVYIGCDEKFNRVEMSHDSFILPNDGRTYYIFHQREYPRQMKRKVIYALFQFFGSNSIKLNPIEELKRYDHVYAIDTNYKEIAVTTAVEAYWLPARSAFIVQHIFTKSFIPSPPEPEKQAWKNFIQNHNNDPKHRYCLVVDSDLDSLIRMNRRENPIIGDFFLPENWQLNYATSDVNDDFLTVRMMRLCERTNKKFSLMSSVYRA